MDAADFKAWRNSLGLSQRAAAKALGVSGVTVQLYERGFRHDDGRPVIIPERIALACEEVTRRRRSEAPETARLSHGQVPERLLQRARAFLASNKVGIEPISALAFHAAHYAPFARLIDEWLAEHARQKGYLKLLVPDEEAEGEALIILHFFDQNDAFSFVLSFRGRSLD
ncbi:helix-turn-helix domain-containing protein [Bosea thiooxidans]|nr:helix-turn-helix domain-containing protein [Bosea sp. (in: a-proteobacteria)]